MGGGIDREQHKAITPHIKLMLRDKLHGCRKITWPHGYRGDDRMNTVFELYIYGNDGGGKRNSGLVQLITNSTLFIEIYQGHVAR